MATEDDIPSPNTTLYYKDTLKRFSKGVYEANLYQEHLCVEDTEDHLEDTGVPMEKKLKIENLYFERGKD